ncbi:MAG: (2Fe-2S)-binding protein [Actinomycetota bacterium]
MRAPLDSPSVTARALADGRPATGRSFRLHRPRSGVCGNGTCGQCGADPATGDARCCTPAGAAPVRRHDPLRVLGLPAERQLPWFWERRLLRPRALRGRYLRVLRGLSAAPGLPSAPAGGPPQRRVVEVGTLHVGDPARADPGALVVDAATGATAFGVYADRTVAVTAPGELLEVRCERLVLATGAHLRLPPVVGNDLPGVLHLDALLRYSGQGADLGALRVAVIAPPERHAAVTAALGDRCRLVHVGARIPDRIDGRGRVRRIAVGAEAVACDAVALGLDQPAIELALLAGARGVLGDGPLPVVVADAVPDWVELRGRAAARERLPGCTAQRDAFACPCEDVRLRDLEAAVASGLRDVELIKRRTGAMTGPCQGKVCQGAVLTALRDLGVEPRPMTPRPFARVTRLADLAVAHDA